MNPPEVSGVGSFIRFEWPEANVRAVLERVTNHKDKVTAEVTILNLRSDGTTGHLLMEQMNLLAGRTKAEVANRLTEKRADVDWPTLVEQFCVMVIRKIRAGEPVQKLGGTTTLPPMLWQAQDLLPLKAPVMFFGDGDTGKSVLALGLACCIQYGLNELGLKVKQDNVLYLDWETDFHDQERRVLMLQNGFMLQNHPLLSYRRCHRPLADDIDEIHRLVLEGDIGYLVIDSLGAAAGTELKEAEAALQFYQAFRSLDRGGLIIHHMPKDGKGPYGTVYFRNYARSVFEIRKYQEPGDTGISIAMRHDKMNNGPKLRPIGWRLEFTQDAITIERKALKRMPELAEFADLKGRIEAELTKGAKLVKDIGANLNSPQSSISTALGRNPETFIHQRDGTWGLRAEEEEK